VNTRAAQNAPELFGIIVPPAIFFQLKALIHINNG